nr:two pore calcium channel protein 1A-like [Ipomoea batatas]
MTHVLYPISYEGFQIYWKNVFNRLKGVEGQHLHPCWNVSYLSECHGSVTSVSSVL